MDPAAALQSCYIYTHAHIHTEEPRDTKSRFAYTCGGIIINRPIGKELDRTLLLAALRGRFRKCQLNEFYF